MLRGLAVTAAAGDRFTLYRAPDAELPADIAACELFDARRVTRRPGPAHFGAVLPAALRKSRGSHDLLFAITHTPIWAPNPVVLTIGDLSFRHHPEHYPHATRMRLEALIPYQARRARIVVAPSEFSRRDIVERLGLPDDKVRVVPNVVEPPAPLGEATRARVRGDLDAHGVGERYVLYLGNLHPRKNVARLIRAFVRARLGDTQLVIAGGRWWGDGDEEAEAAKAPRGTVVMLGRVDDATRQFLLESAVALAYPSLFEGFGLPPIEAMAVGTPALVGDRASLPDIAGDAALAVDPTDVAAIADGLARITTDETLRTELRARGSIRVLRYSRAAAGRAALSAFEAALERDPLEDGVTT